MKKNQLDRLMQIAEKTKSPVIVLDENDKEVVILSLNVYEKMLGQKSVDDVDFSDQLFTHDEFEISSVEPDLNNTFDNSVVGLDERSVDRDVVKQNSQNMKETLGDSAEITEEQFYLEPVE